MDGAQQDQYEARLKELFDSFDVSGTGSLGQEELTDLCRVLHLEEVAPGALEQTLLQDNLQVHFDQFKEALILILSQTLTNEESFQEPDSSLEAQPKFIKGGKRYGRRSLPEFQKSVEDFAEVTVIEPLNEEARPARISHSDCNKHWRSQDSEEYEAEGQLRFWNPDDLTACQNASHTPDWIEEKLQEVCESLGIARDSNLHRKKLVSICEQYGLQNIDAQVLEEVFCSLEPDSTMSIEDFFYGLFKMGKLLPPSASTPYRQLKRHLSMQSFDESGRRTTPLTAMTSTISFRVFSNLDDGFGYAEVEHILDAWHEEGIENSHEILKALDFSLDEKVNLTELALGLENELLNTKNGIYQAALASFKTEIRHLMERVDQVIGENEKLRLDLEKAEKLKSLMASEVDDHHAAIERRNEYNIRKLDEEYKERVAALRNELQKEQEQFQQQAGKQQVDLEQEMEKLKTDENYLRDRLTLTLKENSRLENELLETGEKLAKYESLTSKLQKNLENVLAEKFGDLDPSSAEFFLQEERLMQMRNEYEQQCRELQDQIDELQSQLEEYHSQGRITRPSLQNSLYEELADGGVESGQELGSEDCNPLNMSIEAEMVIEQMRDQHQRDLCELQQKLANTMCHYEKRLEESKTHCDKEQENLRRKYSQEKQAFEQQVNHLQSQVSDLLAELERLRQERQRADSQHSIEKSSLQICLDEKASLEEHLRLQHEEELQARLEEVRESFNQEREELVQARVWMEEKMRTLAQTIQEEKVELEREYHKQLQRLMEKHTLEKQQLQQELADKHQQELQEERARMETEFNGRMSQAEEQFAVDRQALARKYGEAVKSLEERYQRELRELSDLQGEEKSQWEFEKDEIIQEGSETQERLKDMLEKEKAVSSALAQEREILEKDFKECINSLALEKEQLQKELQDMKNRESELHNHFQETQANHEQELKKRAEEILIVEENRKLVSRKLERLQSEFVHKEEELNSRLQEALSGAEEEKKELKLGISVLEGTVEKLQQELLHLSKVQENVACPKEVAEMQQGDSPGPGLTQETRLVRAVISEAQKVQKPAEGDETTVPWMAQLPEKPDRETNRFPGFCPLAPDISMNSQLVNTTDQDNSQVTTENAIKETDGSACLVVEIEGTIFRESIETSLSLEKAYEEIWAENEALKLQHSQLQERISLLEAECDQAAHDRQSMASKVEKELEEILQTIPRPNMLTSGNHESEVRTPHWKRADAAKQYPDCETGNGRLCTEALKAELNPEEVKECPSQFDEDYREIVGIEEGELKDLGLEVLEMNPEQRKTSSVQPEILPLFDELKLENQALKAEVIKLFERNHKLEGDQQQLVSLQHRLEDSNQETLKLKEERAQLLEKVRELETVQDQLTVENSQLQSTRLSLQSRLGKLKEFVASLKVWKGGRHSCCETGEGEKRGLQELNRRLKEKVAVLLKQKGTHARERDDLGTALHGLQATCAEQQQKLELLRCEAENLREENLVLKSEIAFLNEEGNISSLRLKELNGSQEELWQKIEIVRKEKVAVQKMAENLKKQASELKARNQQLELENAELGRKTSPNQADAQDLNQRLLRLRWQREKEAGKCPPEEWERETARLKEELEHCKIQSSTVVSSLEAELSQLGIQAHTLEQENLFLKQELEKVKQLPRCTDLSDLQNEISSIVVKNEKLTKEKEALSDELNRYVEKVAKAAFAENLITTLKQDKLSLEHQNQALKTQVAALQDKNFDDAVQNHQMARLKSDLRVSQQEKDALKQEVMSLHKELQTANDKIALTSNRVLELAVHSAGLQSQQKKLCWDELGQLVKQEQQLLRQENERLQREVQSTKSDLAHSREKGRQLESSIVALKHQKHQSQSGVVKAMEQEKLSLKRECERLQKELTSAHKKISQMNSLERELETTNLENEGLRKKQVKLDEQLMELLHSSASTMLSPSQQHPHDLQQLQQQGCAAVPWEQFQQLQHQLLQAEWKSQHLQEELESRPLETNMAQGAPEPLLQTMEKRMMDIEQQLRLVKRLLQDKVNQLREQLAKNTKADEMVKDLYVENAQLLKALEMTEQRKRTVEKKNYLLEEKIANLGQIVKNLTSPTLASTAQLGS